MELNIKRILELELISIERKFRRKLFAMRDSVFGAPEELR